MVNLEALKLVSIIMTAYNSEATIERSLISIFRQTYSNLEIIVVDDNSQDSTLLILEDYMLLDKRLRVFTTSVNYGPFVCKNYAMSKAKGEYFTFQDSDDYSHPDYVLKSYENLQSNHAKVSYVGSHTYFPPSIMDEYGWGQEYHFYNTHAISAFFGRDVFNEVGYFDSVRYASDGEFLQRLRAYYGSKVSTNRDIITYYYMRRPGSLTCNNKTGYKRYKMEGDRLKYFKDGLRYNSRIERRRIGPYMEFPLNKRKFKIPKSLDPGVVNLNNFKEILIR